MAYVITNGSVMQLTMLGKHENQEVMTVLHYRVSTAEAIADGAAAAEAFLTLVNTAGALVAKWKACLSQTCVALRLRAQWITPLRFAYLPRATDPGNGLVAGDAYPVNTAVAITRRTEFAGRDEVGTIHMPAVPISFIENGNVVADPAGEAYSLFAEKTLEVLNDEAIAAEYYPILFHRANPTEGSQVRTYVLQPTARIMRRRTVGLGT